MTLQRGMPGKLETKLRASGTARKKLSPDMSIPQKKTPAKQAKPCISELILQQITT